MAAPQQGGEPPAQPSLPFRASSKFTLGLVAAVCRGAMFGLQRTEVHDLSDFLAFLDRRRSPETRERGLITGTIDSTILDLMLTRGDSVESFEHVGLTTLLLEPCVFEFKQILVLPSSGCSFPGFLCVLELPLLFARLRCISTNRSVTSIDDPFMWGALPLRYAYDADNMRWSLGSYDLCFRNAYVVPFGYHYHLLNPSASSPPSLTLAKCCQHIVSNSRSTAALSRPP